jgi:hypothetical protein
LGSRLNVFRRDSDTKQETGVIENVTIRNVKARSAAETQLKPPTGVLITGVPGHPIKNLTLENIEISLPGGGTAENARHEVPEAEAEYPEVRTFGPTIPAYGIWARHIEGLKLKKISLTLASSDVRSALIVQDGKNIEISNSRIPVSSGSESVIRFEDVSGAVVKGIKAEGAANAFVKVEGAKSRNVSVTRNKISGIGKGLENLDQVEKNE